MESERELDLFSQISIVSIENVNDKLIVHMKPLLKIASKFEPPNSKLSKMVGVVPKTEVSSVIQFFPPKRPLEPSEHRLTIEEQPVEIVIEQPLDDSSLGNLLKLLGKHTPASLSEAQKASLFGLLTLNPGIVNQVNFKKTGIRIVIRIPEQTFVPLYCLPPLCEHFTGREQELINLHLPRDQDKNVIQIAGTGGIGKSQFANYYARSQFKEKKYEWVIWLRGGDLQNISESLSSQFVDLGRALAVPVDQHQGEPLHRIVYKRLGAKGRGLVIVDDAPNYKAVSTFLPEFFEHRDMDVLITTRNSVKFGVSIRKIILDVFTLEDAKLCISRLLKEKTTDVDLDDLAKTLPRYPLLLTEALTQCNVSQSPSEQNPYQIIFQGFPKRIEIVMRAVINVSLERVKIFCNSEEIFERAMRVLIAASFLAPEVAIPKALLGKWLPEDVAELYINEAIEALQVASLLVEDSQPKTYRIHKAVQDILRPDQTAESSQEKLLRWKQIIESYLGSSGSNSKAHDKERSLMLEAHLSVVSQHLSDFDHQIKGHTESVNYPFGW